MKIAFAGTPRFGALVLESLIRSRHEVAAVFTQPDRPAGRGQKPRRSPVKELALSAGLRVEQPASISSPETIALLDRLGVEVLTIAAFGQILKENLLDAVTCLNVHGSLLPRYRGAAPVERAIMDGEPETGVSIMKVMLALDAGEVYQRQTVPITDADDAGAIYEKLARAGGEALAATLDEMDAGAIRGEPQDESLVTYAEKISAADRRIDWSRPGRGVFNQVRALSPHIGAFTSIAGGASLKIWKTAPAVVTAAGQDGAAAGQGGIAAEQCGITAGLSGAAAKSPAPLPPRPAQGVDTAGAVAIKGERLFVSCGDGLLELLELQPKGKRRMSAAEFLRGYRRLVEGAVLD